MPDTKTNASQVTDKEKFDRSLVGLLKKIEIKKSNRKLKIKVKF